MARRAKTKRTKKPSLKVEDVVAGPKAIEMVNSDLRSLPEKFSSIERMGISELWALSEVISHVQQSIMAFNNAPRFYGDKPYEPNMAGSLLEDLNDTFGWMCQAIIEQIRLVPPKDIDFDNYMEALLSWELRCGSSLGSVMAVMAELAKKKDTALDSIWAD